MSTTQTNVIELAPSVPLSAPWLNGQARRLTLRQPETVNAFLEANHFLIPVIEDASTKLVEYFGAETPQMLEVRFHPEDGSSELFLYVKPSLPVRESRAILDKFGWDWWLDEYPRTQNKMMISLR